MSPSKGGRTTDTADFGTFVNRHLAHHTMKILQPNIDSKVSTVQDSVVCRNEVFKTIFAEVKRNTVFVRTTLDNGDRTTMRTTFGSVESRNERIDRKVGKQILLLLGIERLQDIGNLIQLDSIIEL